VKKLIVIASVAALAVAACSVNTSSINSEQNAVNAQQNQYAKVQPVPYFDYSTQRGLLIDIYRSQNESHQTWAVVTSYSGQLVFQCESEGYPIPASYQLTNPQQVDYVGSGAAGSVGLAEPNGLYTGNTQGTYVMCVRNGKITPIYTENNVQMFPFAVTVDAQGVIHDGGGDATITIAPKYGSIGTAPTATP
jgi:hypothetical protein